MCLWDPSDLATEALRPVPFTGEGGRPAVLEVGEVGEVDPLS